MTTTTTPRSHREMRQAAEAVTDRRVIAQTLVDRQREECHRLEQLMEAATRELGVLESREDELCQEEQHAWDAINDYETSEFEIWAEQAAERRFGA